MKDKLVGLSYRPIPPTKQWKRMYDTAVFDKPIMLVASEDGELYQACGYLLIPIVGKYIDNRQVFQFYSSREPGVPFTEVLKAGPINRTWTITQNHYYIDILEEENELGLISL